ncbi:MAG: YadA-like family protein [Haemophilus seminalis]
MKYELLKRTAIALFVGSVISTYSVAEGGKISGKTSFDDIANAINKNDENISKIKTDVSALAKSLQGDSENPGLLGALEEANKGINENKEALALKANKEDVNKIKKDVSDLAKSLQGDSENPGLLGALEEANKGINENKEALAKKADKADVEALQSDMEKAATAVDTLSENVKELNSAQDTINEDFNNQLLAANATLDEHKAGIDANKAEIAKKANQTDVNANKAEIAKKANQTDVNANKAEIAKKADKAELANKADKDNVYSKSETDGKFALKADNSVVTTQAGLIENLRTDVNAHTKRLDHLDNRVNKLDKDLKRGLAAQAALTGLFQPYTVGKANFTAAVGGYKSQTAVAIGTGYRYNQNIATKAGVAFTQGGGVTYNAGVNFEW